MDTLSLTKALIKRRSITPDDAECQALLISLLKKANFKIKELPKENVQNFWAWHGEEAEPLLIFLGHTDVVPPGNEAEWLSPPFVPTEKSGFLYGRGAADMKSGLAAMVMAAIRFVTNYPNHKGRIGLIVTSDEEGPALHGTTYVAEYLKTHHIKPHYCIVGEATCHSELGDVVKIGRRGSLHGEITVFGKQGHIAYPHLTENPIHRAFAAFHALTEHPWDEGNPHFQPTSFQFHHIESGIASNVVPGSLKAKFNFRFAPVSTMESLCQKIENILNQHALNYTIDWHISAEPYYSGHCKLAESVNTAIQAVCHRQAELNTLGGTSDGRFIAPLGAQVIEFGPVNASIHQVNEHVKLSDLPKLTDIYFRVLESLFFN